LLNFKKAFVSKKIDLFFLTSLFLFIPMIGRIIYNVNSPIIFTIYVSLILIWGIVKSVTDKVEIQHISLFDIGVMVFVFYLILNLCLLTDVSIFYYKIWVYFTFIITFYIFRHSLKKAFKNGFLHFFTIIILSGVAQAIVALCQYYELITVRHDYFLLLGSFTNPNYLGMYVSLCLIFTVPFIEFYRGKSKYKIISYIGIALFFLLVIVLSKSRSVWLSTLVSLIVLALTQRKIKTVLVNLSALKKVISVFVIIVMLLFGVKFMYSLKPDSVKGRALVAKICLPEIIETPFFGHGVFSFAKEYNKAKAKYFEKQERPWREVKNATYVFNPYNDYILVAFELGVIGLGFILFLLAFILVKIKFNLKTRIAVSVLANLSVFTCFNTITNSFILTSLGLFSLAIISLNSNLKMFSVSSSIGKYAFKAGLPIIFIVGLGFTCFKLNYFSKLESFSITDESFKSFLFYSKSIEDNGFSSLYVGQRLYEAGFKTEGKKLVEKAFGQNYAPRIGRVLGYIYKSEKKLNLAEKIFKLNINLEPYRFTPQNDLLKLYEQNHQYASALKVAETIEGLPEKVPSSDSKKYKKTASLKIIKYNLITKSSKNIKGGFSPGKVFRSKTLDKEIPYKIYLPPINRIEREIPVLYVFDGYNYLKKTKLLKIVDDLIKQKYIEPIAVVFLDVRDKKNNWENIKKELFACNDSFEVFVRKEMVPKIEHTYPVNQSEKSRGVLGNSIASSAILNMVISESKHVFFKNIALQSAVFDSCFNMEEFHSNGEIEKIFLSVKEKKKHLALNSLLVKYKNQVQKVSHSNDEMDWEVLENELNDIFIYFYGV